MPNEVAPDGAHFGSGAEAPATATTKKRVNVLDALKAVDPTAGLEVVRLSENETPVIPFSSEGEKVSLHYCEEPEIGGYVQCNEEGCILCRAGRKPDSRTLIPVYMPAARAIGVLAVSPSLRPHALLPQLQPVLTAKKPMVAFIKKDGSTKFIVSSSELPKDADGGEDIIIDFLNRWKSGAITLESAFQTIPNDQLKSVPGIARILELKSGAAR